MGIKGIGGYCMLSRNENGKLRLKDFTLSLILDDLFEQCETTDETNWLYGKLNGGAYESCVTRNEQLDNNPCEIIEEVKCNRNKGQIHDYHRK